MHSTHTARPSTRGRPTTRPSMWEVTGPATGPQTVHTEYSAPDPTRSYAFSAAVCASMAVSPLGPGMGRWPQQHTSERAGRAGNNPRCHADGLARLSGTDGEGHNRDTAVALTPLSEHSCRGYSVDQTRHAVPGRLELEYASERRYRGPLASRHRMASKGTCRLVSSMDPVDRPTSGKVCQPSSVRSHRLTYYLVGNQCTS